MPANLSEKENAKSQVDTTNRPSWFFFFSHFQCANERNLQANLEEYDSDVLNQLLSVLWIQKVGNFAHYVINK